MTVVEQTSHNDGHYPHVADEQETKESTTELNRLGQGLAESRECTPKVDSRASSVFAGLRGTESDELAGF